MYSFLYVFYFIISSVIFIFIKFRVVPSRRAELALESARVPLRSDGRQVTRGAPLRRAALRAAAGCCGLRRAGPTFARPRPRSLPSASGSCLSSQWAFGSHLTGLPGGGPRPPAPALQKFSGVAGGLLTQPYIQRLNVRDWKAIRFTLFYFILIFTRAARTQCTSCGCSHFNPALLTTLQKTQF